MTAGRILFRGRAVAPGSAVLDERERIAIGSAVAWTMACGLACGGGTLLARRLAGGFSVTPGAAAAWSLVAAGWTLLAATDLGSRIGGDQRPSWLARCGLAAAALAFAPFGEGPSWPVRLAGASAVVIALVAAAMPPAIAPRGTLAAGPLRTRGGPTGRGAGLGSRREAAAAGESRRPADGGRLAEAMPGFPGDSAAGFRQRLERFETQAGDDCLRGHLLLTVPAGSRTGHAHVGFCPPFSTTPLVEASTDCDFVEAEITAAEILPWGVRIECRLSEPAEEPLEIPVDLLARNPA